MKNYKANKAFTLAETLIVIAVLGIVAMLTVPNVIRQHMEAVARTKIKKSMTVYDMAITKMTVENDLRSDTELIKWSNEVDNCGNTVAYFKTANNKSCEFKTSDGVWWDISDIMNPIIALSIDDLHTAQAEGINGKTSFKLVASFDRQSGAFRVDDLGYEKLKLEAQLALAPEEQPEDVQENIEELELLFGFINDKKDKNGGSEEVCEITRSCSGSSCFEKNCHGKITTSYGGCDGSGNNCSYSYKNEYDANGNITVSYSCDGSGNNCSSSSKNEYDDNGKLKIEYKGCDVSGNNCSYSFKHEYDNNGNLTTTYSCDGSGNNCFSSSKTEYDDNGNQTAYYEGCDGSGNNCSSSSKNEYDDNGNQTAYYGGCDGSGNNCSSSSKNEYDDNGNLTAYYDECDGSGNNCSYSFKFEYDANGNWVADYYCDGNGENCEQW